MTFGDSLELSFVRAFPACCVLEECDPGVFRPACYLCDGCPSWLAARKAHERALAIIREGVAELVARARAAGTLPPHPVSP